MKLALSGNMKLAAVAVVGGIAFAAWKGNLLNGILNKVSPPATVATTPPAPLSPNTYPPVQYPAQQQQQQLQVPPQIDQPTFQFPQYPAIPTGIAGVPPPIVNPFSNIPILPDSGLANNALFRPSPPTTAPNPYNPFINPLLYNTLTNASVFPGMQPVVSNSSAPRVDFFDPSNPPTESQSTTSSTAPAKSSVAYAFLGTKTSKHGRFGSLRDSAFTVNPLEQEAIGNSYRRPAFYAPHTLSNI